MNPDRLENHRRNLPQKFDDGRFLYFIRNLVNHLDESKKQTGRSRRLRSRIM